jgi:hypothetical protein
LVQIGQLLELAKGKMLATVFLLRFFFASVGKNGVGEFRIVERGEAGKKGRN